MFFVNYRILSLDIWFINLLSLNYFTFLNLVPNISKSLAFCFYNNKDIFIFQLIVTSSTGKDHKEIFFTPSLILFAYLYLEVNITILTTNPILLCIIDIVILSWYDGDLGCDDHWLSMLSHRLSNVRTDVGISNAKDNTEWFWSKYCCPSKLQYIPDRSPF